ncbi:hypothetical protein, variant [Thecamonas trahens ATCC 50062]|uniref:C2H2-type domain-containing protein n=1 Tax=Thecamonas trahens ATCC 50062 TaxID=461836 RepID=A0A0L0D7K4_THETB|nr:hypothetical protein AMSG_04404 [Thecamonas trahens ATCC 50062]XP_013758746.1 hypothetical protein, variant [Thecamonas trahens ATCC 50062]KNC48175.1 hypothetical protein, variant [Thecamonas trahens ATCC 50062]KNC48176.1 hypothetical protein AMSG_04404 [Thecamonas trahens ATCC 50062]|eukprot:XP_013758745.1 hypothetical protein AMSG_04404 [Thecamonas trahens ATCC 50062]
MPRKKLKFGSPPAAVPEETRSGLSPSRKRKSLSPAAPEERETKRPRPLKPSGSKTTSSSGGGGNNLKCPVDGCPYSCRFASLMIIHCRKHSGEKPFLCTYPKCAHRCSQKANLKTHYKNCHLKKTESGQTLTAEEIADALREFEPESLPTPMAVAMAQSTVRRAELEAAAAQADASSSAATSLATFVAEQATLVASVLAGRAEEAAALAERQALAATGVGSRSRSGAKKKAGKPSKSKKQAAGEKMPVRRTLMPPSELLSAATSKRQTSPFPGESPPQREAPPTVRFAAPTGPGISSTREVALSPRFIDGCSVLNTLRFHPPKPPVHARRPVVELLRTPPFEPFVPPKGPMLVDVIGSPKLFKGPQNMQTSPRIPIASASPASRPAAPRVVVVQGRETSVMNPSDALRLITSLPE